MAPVASSTLYTHDGEIVEGSLRIDSNGKAIGNPLRLAYMAARFLADTLQSYRIQPDVTHADIPTHRFRMSVIQPATNRRMPTPIYYAMVEYVTPELMPDLADDVDLNTVVDISHWHRYIWL